MANLWANYEERVMVGCTRFLAACRRNGFEGEVHHKTAAEWASGMRAWLAEGLGEDWDLLDEVVDEMRDKEPPLIVASPRSCIKIALDKKMWARPEKDYIHGELAEFIEH